MPSLQCSLLLLQLVGGCELIEQLSIHLHEGLEHIVDQRYDGSWHSEGRGEVRFLKRQCGPNSLSGILLILVPRYTALHTFLLFTTPCHPDTFSDPLQLGAILGAGLAPSPSLDNSLIPVLLGDLVEGPKHSRQHSVAVVLNEAQDILVVPEVQSPLCNLG
jgi:hypothetical protein